MADVTHPPDRGRSQFVRAALIVAGALAAIHAIAFVTLLTMQQAHTGRTLPNVQLGAHDVGGIEREHLNETVASRASEHLEQPVVAEVEASTVRSTRRALGLRVDASATAEEVWSRGRGGLWSALFDQVRSRLGSAIEVGYNHELDEETFDAWVGRTRQQLSTDPRPAGVGLIHAEEPDVVDVHVVEPRPGWTVPADQLRSEARRAVVDTTGPVDLELDPRRLDPEVTAEDAQAVIDDARLAVSAPVVMTNPSQGPDLTLDPGDLALVLSVDEQPGADEGQRLRVAADPAALLDHLGLDGVAALEADPVDASFEVAGEQVVIHGGTPGFALDPAVTSRRLLEAALEEAPRIRELAGDLAEPNFSHEQAQELGITQRISSFTTPHDCCPPRVHNIQLAADILRGQIIRPGERFSLNRGIGPRTRARGFTSNGAIEDGELQSVVGGGVSQIGTTFLNAAWFSGIRLIDFTPHSLYFERYPMGREATLAWNVLDVVVENDTPYGILIHTSYTNTSITFEFWSTEWMEVDSETVGPFNPQSGTRRDGFDVIVRRTTTHPDGTSRSEEYFHRYEPQD